MARQCRSRSLSVSLLAGRDPYALNGVVTNIERTLFPSGAFAVHSSRMIKDQIVVVVVPYFDAVRSLDNHMIFGMDFGSVQALIPWGDPQDLLAFLEYYCVGHKPLPVFH